MVWGDSESGKSALLACLTNSTEREPPSYTPEKGVLYLDYQYQSTILKYWELGGSLSSERARDYLNMGDLILYCLDMSQCLDCKKLVETISFVKDNNPIAPIFLIGTKEDLLDNNSKKQTILSTLTEFLAAEESRGFMATTQEKFPQIFFASSLTQQGIQPVFQAIYSHFIPTTTFSRALEYISPELQLHKAIVQLEQICHKLPLDKADRIARETLTLAQGLTSFNQTDPSVLTKVYLKKCEACLQGANPKLKAALRLTITIAMIALISALTAGIIFSIGLWFSWWMGPALLNNILLSTFATINGRILLGCMGGLGIVVDGAILFGLFKFFEDTLEVKAIKKVVFEAKKEFSTRERSSSC